MNIFILIASLGFVLVLYQPEPFLTATSNMRAYILLSVFVSMIVLQAEASHNLVLGSFNGQSASKFGSGTTETRYFNNNGIQEAYTVHTSYEQKPDNSCVKRTVEKRNRVESVQEEPIDCHQAENIIKQNQEKTHKQIKDQTEKLESNIKKQQKEIEDSIKNSFANFW